MKELLNECTVEGNVIKVPTRQLDRKTYVKLQKALVGIGGKWKGGKVFGFEFDSDPSDLLASIQGGDKINLKKDFQFFETPDLLADRLVDLADIGDGMDILEPSAGRGAILQAIRRKIGLELGWESWRVYAIELMDDNRKILAEKFPNVHLCGIPDFLDYDGMRFDRIIANPPFTKNQDIQHIYKMYSLLSPGGRLVSMSSGHWEQSTNKKETIFRMWLDEVGAQYYFVPQGEFKSSGTMVASNIIVINKPK